MELEFKKDFQEARKKWDTFWNGGELSRPLMSIVVPKEGVEPVEKPAMEASIKEDSNAVIEQLLGWASTHEFLGEAMPFYQILFAPDHFALFLGAELKYHEEQDETGWVLPFVESWQDTEIKFDKNNKWFQKTVEKIRAFRARCDGKLIIAGPHLQAGLDCLSAIRGPGKLAMDLVMEPDNIKKALEQVCVAYEEVLEALYEEMNVAEYGNITRHQMYSTGRIQVPQNDFSCMISEDMFKEFGLGCLDREVVPLDASTYHLDGPDAIRHLESICEIEGIKSIQWQPGAGEAAEKDWTDLYKKIDSLGKRQVIGGGGVMAVDHEYIKKLCRECDKTKLFFCTTAESVKQAEQLMSDLEKI